MVKNWIFCFLPWMFTAVLMGACQSNSGTPVNKKPDEKVLAKIGDEVFTLKRFEEFYENLPQEYLFKYHGESGKRALLEQLVELKMYAQKAQQIGLDKDPQNQRRIQEAREKILATAFHVKEVIEKVTVSDEEIQNYYELHKKEHIRPEQVKVREIIVTEKKEAEETIKLIRMGTRFESLARERSADRDRGAKGGDMGWHQRGKGEMDKAVEEVAFSMKVGEIGGPIKTQYGYHIIKVEDRSETHQRSLKETYQPIKNKIRNIKQRELMAQLKTQVKQELNVKIDWDLLKQVPVRQAPSQRMFPGRRGEFGLQSKMPSKPDKRNTIPEHHTGKSNP